ncbi:MAG: hypothetical protein WBB89_02965 [Candidatus Acidiferrum sp.]
MGFLLALLSEKPAWWDVAWSTWVLVAVGIVAAYIGLQTLVDIKKQTQALINDGRSWIMVEVQPIPGAGPIFDGKTVSRGIRDIVAENTAFTARIICKNDGKTPAWITEKRACIDIVDSLPETPDWTRTQPIQIEPEPLSVGQIGRPKDETLMCKRPREHGKMFVLIWNGKVQRPLRR